MDEIWERAVETALDGQTDPTAARSLTLDGAAKCVQGRLPPPSLLEKYQNLQHLSIANIGVSSLEQFPRLQNLQKLILSDNRIAGGLEFLVEAGPESLRDLDLSNNRIQYIEDLAPLAQLKLVSLDLYECPVTRVKDYRSRVFGLIKSLKYLDKMDADENERPESDDEDEDEEEEEDDPGSGEIDGEDRPYLNNGHSEVIEEIVEVDEENESDADEVETETVRQGNGPIHPANGFRLEAVNGESEEDDSDDDEFIESDEESDEDEEGEEDDVVEVHQIVDSDDEEDGVEDDDSGDDDDSEDEDDDSEDEDREEVDNEEGDLAEANSTGRLPSTEGEIDGHEQGEDDGDDDDNGETGEEEPGMEYAVEFEDEEEDEDCGEGYLVQPVNQAEEVHDVGSSDTDPVNEEEEDIEEEEEVDDDEEEVQVLPTTSPPKQKRKRDDNDDDEDDNGNGDEDEDDNNDEDPSSKKKQR